VFSVPSAKQFVISRMVGGAIERAPPATMPKGMIWALWYFMKLRFGRGNVCSRELWLILPQISPITLTNDQQQFCGWLV
jgi:hypothetical protein